MGFEALPKKGNEFRSPSLVKFVRDISASRPFLADSAETAALVGFARW